MTTKITIRSNTKKQAEVLHPGMMGDGTEEQNLNERGNPGGRIKKDAVEAVFGKQSPERQSPKKQSLKKKPYASMKRAR
jgi:hypothetical protein